MRIAVALLSVMVACPVFAIEAGQSYASARAELIDEGWQPAQLTDRPDANCDLRSDVCEAFPEAMACAPTGAAPCLFRFERGGETKVVATENEAAEDLVVTGTQ